MGNMFPHGLGKFFRVKIYSFNTKLKVVELNVSTTAFYKVNSNPTAEYTSILLFE